MYIPNFLMIPQDLTDTSRKDQTMLKDTNMQTTASQAATRRSPFQDPGTTFVHLFIIALEIGLLAVQYFRMEALTFDLLPDIADLDFGFFYGTHLMGGLWLMLVVFVSYICWESTIRLHQRGKSASGALRATVISFWLLNAATMVFEFVLFRMLVDDFSSLGIAGAAELFGLIMVAAHQACSFWIVKNVVRDFFHTERTAQASSDAAEKTAPLDDDSDVQTSDVTPIKFSSTNTQ